ncbi:MAG: carboxypeptidase-like regulatory domain-containing protein [Bacteroidota bacterium]|nr:carboxypeptidase-like regulatory domain-containing protein [Bacteroidota bacterium]
MKRLFFLFMLLFWGVLQAQNIKVKGVVRDSLQKPVDLATVMAVNLQTDKIDGYNITNEKGQYVLHLKPNSKYAIKVSFLGYSPISVDLETKNEDITLPIELEGAGFLIEGVEVVHQMPVTIVGDTLVYNADSFTRGTERKLEDLLKRLPGVEVDEDGGVKVEGKDVKKLMLDGKDFFDGDTKLGVKNIPADAVDKVQVIKNYNEVEQLKSVSDNKDDLAMNITLKENKKNFWFGDVSAGVGVARDDGRYLVNPKLFYNSKKYSVSLITNMNNIGEQPISYSDYFKFTGGMRNLMKKGGTTIDISNNDLEILQANNNRAKDIRSRFVAADINYSPTNKISINGYTIISDNRIDMQTWTRNSILNTDTGDVLTSQETTDNIYRKGELIIGKLDFKYKPNSKITLDYDVFFKKSKQIEDYNIHTQVIPDVLQSQDIQTFTKQDPMSFNQSLALYYAPNQKHVISAEIMHFYNDENPFYNANLGQKPFDLHGYIDGELRHNINQERFVKTSKTDVKIDYYYALNKISNINLTLGATHSYQHFNSHIFQILDSGNTNHLTDSSLNNDVDYVFNDTYLGLHYKIMLGKLTLTPGISAHSYLMEDTQKGSVHSRRFARFLPDMSINYEITSSKTLQYRYSMTNNFTDIINLSQGYVFRGYNNLFYGNRNLENATYQNHNLYYWSFKMFNMEFVAAGLNYNRMVNNINSRSAYNGINAVNTVFNSNFADHTLLAYLTYGRNLFRDYKVNLNGTFSWSEYNVMQTNPLTNISVLNPRQSLMQNYRATIITNFEEMPNIEVGYNFGINTYPEDTFYNIGPVIGLDYHFLKAFSFTADYKLSNYYNRQKTVENNYDFLEASIAYKEKESPWECRLSATNILNTKTLNSDSFSSFMISTSQHYIQPRYVILTLKYNL